VEDIKQGAEPNKETGKEVTYDFVIKNNCYMHNSGCLPADHYKGQQWWQKKVERRKGVQPVTHINNKGK